MNEPREMTHLSKQYRTAQKNSFRRYFTLNLKKTLDLRYGENPQQKAALFQREKKFKPIFKILKGGKGGLSATNAMDIFKGMDLLKSFSQPAVTVMKHLIPSGFATDEKKSLQKIYQAARDADARSAFGSVVVFNREVDSETAAEICLSYVELVAAPSISLRALEQFSQKKDLRVIQFQAERKKDFFDLKFLSAGYVVVQESYPCSFGNGEKVIRTPFVKKGEQEFRVKREPTMKEWNDLLMAWKVNLGVRSNGIVLVKGGVTLAISSGQQERVGAVELAITKALQKALDRKRKQFTPGGMGWEEMIQKLGKNPLSGAVVSSDAFFPFRDSVDLLAKMGIKAIIQPGGSLKDAEVIQAVNEAKMAMVFTQERCFGHF